MDKGVRLAKLFQICGAEDFLYEDNVDFKDFTLSLNADLEYTESGGNPDWNFGDYAIKEVIDCLSLIKKEKEGY